MSIISRLTQKHLWSNKRRTWVTIIGVILCTAMICAVSTLIGSFRNYLMECDEYSSGAYHVSFSAMPYEKVPQLQANAEVSSVGTSYAMGGCNNIKTENPEKPYIYVMALDEAAEALLPVHLVEGRLPQTPNEIALPQHLITNGGVSVSVGQTITLSLGQRTLDGEPLSANMRYVEGESIASPVNKTYTVVGVIERMGTESYNSASYIGITALNSAALAQDTPVNAYLSLAHPSNAYHLIPGLAQSLGITEEHTNYNAGLLAYYGSFASNDTDLTFTSLAVIVIALIMLGSVSVIYNAFAISATERKAQFGLLASVGATQKQIRKSVWLEGLTVGAIGIPLGIGLGIGGIGITLKLVQSLLLDLFNTPGQLALTLHVSPTLTLLAAVIAAVTIALSVYLPAKRASKTSPIEAIRTTQDIKSAGRVHANRLTQRVFGFEANLALKQMQRNRKRYRTTIFSLFISLVMFLSFSSFVDYMNVAANMQLQTADYDYIISSNGTERSAQALLEVYDDVQSNAYLDSAVLRATDSFSFKLDEALFTPQTLSLFRENQYIGYDSELGCEVWYMSLYALPDAEYDALLAGQGLSSPDRSGLVLVSPFEFRDEEGKMHQFNGVNPSALPRPLTLFSWNEIHTVENGEDVYTADGYVSADVNVIGALQTLPSAVFPSSTSISALCSESEYRSLCQSLKSEPLPFSLYLTANDTEAFDAWMAEHPVLGKERSGLNVYSLAAMVAENERVLFIISIFCYGFITLMMLISVTSVLNTISTNMQLRKKEFAMLQSVGMTKRAMGRMLRFESFFYGVKALLYALPVSIGISYLMYRLFAQSFSFPFTLPWMQYLGAVLGVFLLVFATMGYATRKMRKQSIVETIRQDSI